MRFPRYHLATSVVNRILDMADHELIMAKATEQVMPDLSKTQQQGAALDEALSTPMPAIPAPEGTEEAVILESSQGGTAADAVGGMAVLDAL